jgi:hypothetical protein
VILTAFASSASVDTSGVAVDAGVDGPVLVEFDGQYVWSFTPGRDGTRRGSIRHTPWPPVLRPYLSGATRVTVRTADGPATLHDDEVRFDAAQERTRVADRKGHPLAVDKVGHLQRVFAESDDSTREEILRGTARALRDLREACGVEAYLNYGCLLGAVRDGRMVGHDSDSDLCYYSEHTSPADIITESYRIERTMLALGWNLLRMSGGDIKLLLRLTDGRDCHIDVFVAFHVDGRFYQLGNRSGELAREAVLPVSTVTLEGHRFPAPRDPEAMLAFLYGRGWRTPDPSFKYADPPEGVRRLDGWLRGFRTEMGRWTELYNGPGSARVPRGPSPFAGWALDRIAPREPVAEIGSGTGSDAVRFAQRGHPVRAFDFSRRAVRRTGRRLERVNGTRDARRLILNELRSVLLAGAELASEERPHHLYARHLVGCLDDAARDNLWRLADMGLRRGTSLFLEFAGDPSLPQAHPLVRRTDVTQVRAELAARGLEVVEEESGPGTDMFGDPDPLVHRLHVRREPRGENR